MRLCIVSIMLTSLQLFSCEEEPRYLKDQRGTGDWPDIIQWKHRLISLTMSLSKAAQKVKDEEHGDSLKHELVFASAKAKAEELQKKIMSDKVCQELKDAAQAELDKIPHLKRCFENLREEYQNKAQEVRNRPQLVCGSCRWSSGCLRCDPDKALEAYLKKEFGLQKPWRNIRWLM